MTTEKFELELGTTIFIRPGKREGVRLTVYIADEEVTSKGKIKLNDRDVDDLIHALNDARSHCKKAKK